MGCAWAGLILLLAFVLVVGIGWNSRNGSFFTDAGSPLVKTARGELGNVGGEKFWSWYGYDDRVDWCGCFVSWCADQNGYLDEGLVPKFSYVQEAVNWYHDSDMWQDPEDYTPRGGEIIFFDWNGNEVADHVGIVSGSKFGRVFTIEGNTTGDICKRKGYWHDRGYIMGYGTPES